LKKTKKKKLKSFVLPKYYESKIISEVKNIRTVNEKRTDYSPTKLTIGKLNFYIPKYFGFCFGVKNAIEICYKTLEENPDKNIYLISEVIHNPDVNDDLKEKGIIFLQKSSGETIVPWKNIDKNDIVIIPAFGTTKENMEIINKKGIKTKSYDTTCPFVTKVWNRGNYLAEKNYTIIIHGKPEHEETKATFSNFSSEIPRIIIKNIQEAKLLSKYILDERKKDFKKIFKGRISENFNQKKDFKKIGVVNQTTMLAEETQEISNFFEKIMEKKYGIDNLKNHIANTRDTLCYATNENQTSIKQLIDLDIDLAFITGGYNSSNTSQLVKICENYFKTYFISSEKKLISEKEIIHFDMADKIEKKHLNYLPNKKKINFLISGGASCPDSVLERLLEKICKYYNQPIDKKKIIQDFLKKY
tara:strand:+ start:1252 stop:2499 length:1248 start_codon:yes stop_codon:yes gene_type:complete